MKSIVEIDESTIRSTTKCDKGFQCLHGETEQLCEVEYCVQDKVCFVKCLNIKRCSYRIHFGHSFVCNCPVRKEIFKRYKY
jgi:hypothetical protein